VVDSDQPMVEPQALRRDPSCLGWTRRRGPHRRRSAAREEADAIIINPAAFSFTSIALIDALKTFDGPIIELHISNIHARDPLHRDSKISSVAKAVICGLGVYGYVVALQAAAHMLKALPDSLPAPLRLGPA
jgi:3-dehydroquinate dehydratase-2